MTTEIVRGGTVKILVLNPNSSHDMTLGLQEMIKGMELSPSTEVHTYTAPSTSPASINDEDDLRSSTHEVTCNLSKTGLLEHYDAVLVACFSVHPLVSELQINDRGYGKIPVSGIFEASILTCLSFLQKTFPHKSSSHEKWGIVTTGKFWEKHLTVGVNEFLGAEPEAESRKFVGVESTGLNAGDFHGGVDPGFIREKLKEATKRLLRRGNVKCVVMGCAGMAGLEDIIRKAAHEEYSPSQAYELLVVDGVKAGIGLLEQMIRNKRAFQCPR